MQDNEFDEDSDIEDMHYDMDLYDLYELYIEAEGSDSDEAWAANDNETAADSKSS